jgi:hypothetical protein
LRFAFVLAICALLTGCGVGFAGRGVDPRDNTAGANSTVATNGSISVPGAIGLFSGPTVMNWLSRTFLPDQHKDVPPPPATQRADGERSIVEQDCSNPVHRTSEILPCQ